MERLNLWWFYWLGYSLHGITEIEAGTHWTQVYGVLDNGRKALKAIQKEALVPLPHCILPARDLNEHLDDIMKPPDREIYEAEAKFIVTSVQHLETLIIADVGDQYAFHVQRVGIFNIGDLLTGADGHLPGLARANIDTEPRAEIQEAGVCLAFHLYTAVGFHSLRALEAVARGYLTHLSKGSRVLTDEPLGQIIADLVVIHEKEPDPKQRDETLGLVVSLLRRVKDLRNRIMHPELVLDADAALDTFNLVGNAISVMESDLVRRKMKPMPKRLTP